MTRLFDPLRIGDIAVANRIVNGSSRNWGPASSMSAQGGSLTEADTLAAWILSLK